METTDRLPEPLAEILEALWTLEENGIDSLDELPRAAKAEVSVQLVEELKRRNLISVDDGVRFKLAHVDDSEDAACEFEHVLAEGIANSICTLLGHPRFCPHGMPIPEGECCRSVQEEVYPILVPSDQLDVGESAVIAYLCTTQHSRMMKLSSLGVTPGNRLKLLQKWPSFVFQCDETEIAVEQEVTRNIYVRRQQKRNGA